MQQHIAKLALLSRPSNDIRVGVQQICNERCKVSARNDVREHARHDDVAPVDPGKMCDELFIILATEHKPRVALIGNPAVGPDRHARLHQSAFNAIELRKLSLSPILLRLAQTKKWNDARTVMHWHCP